MERFHPLLWAVVVLAFHTFAVAVRLLVARIGEMRRRRIHPQKVATSKGLSELECVAISDNFKNLFEMPVLFYVVCVLLMVTGHVTTFFVAAAWLYVALRIVHSWIHCTYNKVMHRFYAFFASVVVLAAMWAGFAATLLSG